MKDVEAKLNIPETKGYTFPETSYIDWVQKVEKSLKGKSVSEFISKTYEGIEIHPLYTREDVPNEATEIQLCMKKEASWFIAQKVEGNSVKEVNEQLLQSLRYGANALSFHLLPDLTTEQMDVLFNHIPVQQYPFFVDDNAYSVGFYLMLADWLKNNKVDRNTITGFIGTDPFQSFFQQSNMQKEWEIRFTHWAEGVLFADRQFPNVKTIFIDSSIFERRGAHSVQQLAYALSEIVHYVEYFRKKGMNEKDIFRKVVVAFSVRSDFFMEIAKLRAFRYLWKKLIEAYGIEEQIDATLFAETSIVNKTKMDRYMNLIRTGNEAFSAVVGQVDYLRIGAFDELFGSTSDKGKRLSLNIHHILKEEAGLAKVSDPAAGSFFLEHLTKKLIEQAWTYFVELEDKGGFFSVLSKGTIQKELKNVQSKRQKDFNEQKKILVGTNRYAEPKEKIPSETIQGEIEKQQFLFLPFEQVRLKVAQHGTLRDCVKPLPSNESNESRQSFRLSEPLERCRQELEKQIGENNRLVGFIINGDYVTYKRIVDFTSDFFASVGLDLALCTEGMNREKVKRFLEETEPVLYGYFTDGRNQVMFCDSRPVFYVSDQSKGRHDQLIRQGEHLYLYPGIDQISFFKEMIRTLEGRI